MLHFGLGSERVSSGGVLFHEHTFQWLGSAAPAGSSYASPVWTVSLTLVPYRLSAG